MKTPKKRARILFDNGGSTYLLLCSDLSFRYCHKYDDAKHAAQDYVKYQAGDSPKHWEGHDEKLRDQVVAWEKHPNDFGLNWIKIYDEKTIAKADTEWGENVSQFVAELKQKVAA